MLTNSPPNWRNNNLLAHNRGSRSLLSKVENIADGGLAARGVVVASALFYCHHDSFSAGASHGAT